MSTATLNCKPILFKPPLVRAILENRKSQTMRVVKPQPTLPHKVNYSHADGTIAAAFSDCKVICDGAKLDVVWARYKVGDILWVRENFASVCGCGECDGGPEECKRPAFLYMADGADVIREYDDDFDELGNGRARWSPSIHMPFSACRLFLEVTAVTTQRPLFVDHDEALLEGAESVEQFRRLWDEINAKRGYGIDVNPWCFAYRFKRVERPAHG